MKDSQCIFCNLGPDKEIIAENKLAVAFYDGFPVNPGHALIIPKRHVANYFDLSMDECVAMQALLKEVQTKVEERFHPGTLPQRRSGGAFRHRRQITGHRRPHPGVRRYQGLRRLQAGRPCR